MKMVDYVNDKIKRKINTNTIIKNLYSDKEMVEFYNYSTTKNSFSNDISYYKSRIKKDEFVIELASGSGRIIKDFILSGYKIYGIELESEMINSLERKYQKFIYQENIFNVYQLSNLYQKADVLILAATSVSLFTEKEFFEFLEKVKFINKKFKIIFDWIDPISLTMKNPKRVLMKNGIYYYTNFQLGENIVYNLYHEASNTLGISVKVHHTLSSLVNNLQKIGFQVNTQKIDENYYMIEGVIYEC